MVGRNKNKVDFIVRREKLKKFRIASVSRNKNKMLHVSVLILQVRQRHSKIM
jgi:hypothetical protein